MIPTTQNTGVAVYGEHTPQILANLAGAQAHQNGAQLV